MKSIRLDLLVPVLLRVCAGSIGLLLNYAIISALGANEAGKFVTFLSLASVIGLVCTLGLDSFVLRELATWSTIRNYQRYTAIYITVFCCVLLFSLLTSLALYQLSNIGAQIISLEQLDKWHSIVQTTSFALVPISLVAINSEALKSIGHVSKAIVLRLLLAPVITICIIFYTNFFCFSTEFSPSEIYVMACWIAFVLSMFFFCRHSRFELPNINEIKKTLYFLKKESLFLFIFSISSASIPHLSLLLLAKYSSPEKVALLSVCLKVSMIISIFLSAINSVLIPKAVKLYALGDIDGLQNIVQRYTLVGFAASVPFAILIWTFSDVLLKFISSDFAGYYYILNILVFGQLINACVGPVAYMSIVLKDTKYLSYVFLGSALLCGILISLYNGQIKQTAISIAFCVGFVNIFLFWRIKTKFGILTTPTMAKSSKFKD